MLKFFTVYVKLYTGDFMKTVLITGGAGGIGKACAELFRNEGYDVYVTVNETPCDLDGVTKIRCDLSNINEIENLFSNFDSLDVLVNNAGVSLIKMINDTTPEDFNKVMSVNSTAAFFASKYAALLMLKKHRGKIINISSMWGQEGASCEVAYSMSKASVIGLTKALAKELAPSGITVNCVSPGIIDTEMNKMFDKQELASEVPLGRLGEPFEVAKAVLFFAENDYLTGQILGVNGGIV